MWLDGPSRHERFTTPGYDGTMKYAARLVVSTTHGGRREKNGVVERERGRLRTWGGDSTGRIGNASCGPIEGETDSAGRKSTEGATSKGIESRSSVGTLGSWLTGIWSASRLVRGCRRLLGTEA